MSNTSGRVTYDLVITVVADGETRSVTNRVADLSYGDHVAVFDCEEKFGKNLHAEDVKVTISLLTVLSGDYMIINIASVLGTPVGTVSHVCLEKSKLSKHQM